MTLVTIGTQGPRKQPDNPETAGAGPVLYEDLHPVLQALCTEHRRYIPELQAAEEVLIRVQRDGPDQAADRALGRLFKLLETEVLPNNRRQEKFLFPLVRKRLEEEREPGAGASASAMVDRLEAEHVNMIQISAVMLNFFGLAGHLPDQRSQRMVIEFGIEQGKALIEMLRLHMDRKEDVLFSQAHRLLSTQELDQMKDQMK